MSDATVEDLTATVEDLTGVADNVLYRSHDVSFDDTSLRGNMRPHLLRVLLDDRTSQWKRTCRLVTCRQSSISWLTKSEIAAP
jgi:hypothetical protein